MNIYDGRTFETDDDVKDCQLTWRNKPFSESGPLFCPTLSTLVIDFAEPLFLWVMQFREGGIFFKFEAWSFWNSQKWFWRNSLPLQVENERESEPIQIAVRKHATAWQAFQIITNDCSHRGHKLGKLTHPIFPRQVICHPLALLAVSGESRKKKRKDKGRRTESKSRVSSISRFTRANSFVFPRRHGLEPRAEPLAESIFLQWCSVALGKQRNKLISSFVCK